MFYFRWLQRGAPCASVERYPYLNAKGESTLKGVYVAGDLSGMPLLKFAADQGSQIIQGIYDRKEFEFSTSEDVYDILIVGAGPAGASAAIQAKKLGLRFLVLESNRPFSTIANFPQQKPIFLEPKDYQQTGPLTMRATVKESLLQELEDQFKQHQISITSGNVTEIKRNNLLLEVYCGEQKTLAKRVLLAIGKSGNYRKLGVPGEDQSKVSNRLLDPKAYHDQDILVVGGGDSALEASIACAEQGARVTLSYRNATFSRPKQGNQQKIQELVSQKKIQLQLATQVKKIEEKTVTLLNEKKEEFTLPNTAVLVMIGSELPLKFLEKCKIELENAMNAKWWISLVAVLSAVTAFYLWKANYFLANHHDFTDQVKRFIPLPEWFRFDNLMIYSLLYGLIMLVFGIRRIRRTPTSYVKKQTLLLLFIQWVPLTLIPLVFIPMLDAGHYLPDWFKIQVLELPPEQPIVGFDAWKFLGLILAWPLFPWIVISHIGSPMSLFWCLYTPILSFFIIPLLIYYFGKGSYCGWICSCGGLAETLGDPFRQKTPHGPFAKKLENFGQVVLWFCVLHSALTISTWTMARVPANLRETLNTLNTVQKFCIDIALASIIGVGLYGHFGGRVWCRFACPLAALMHLYTKFSLYRIFADKKRCISCNVCTKVCHMGIDVMNFANKGTPMDDVECVRCSACVSSCPTQVLSFGRLEHLGGTEPAYLETSSHLNTTKKFGKRV
ncbi:MAG: NAD(P)-binding domain-containing protein [Planctomycetota bacterium]